jgi:alginate O-acetyltransferase complex protein AlgI
MRYAEFRNQQIDKTAETSNFAGGLYQFGIGLAKKLIVADYLAIVVNALFGNHDQLGMIGAWAAALAYTYQIYFDFSGYSDMAIGIGQLLGFRIPQNFNAPYMAATITEFWQRWHMTLSNWFRYYVFTPLSRGLIRLEGNRRPEVLRTISLITTMALVGLWHGAGWTFILWGAYHGGLLAIHAQVRRQKDMPSAWRLIIYRLFTFLLVVIGWVLFRSPSLEAALGLYGAMIGLRGLGLQDMRFVPNLGGLELLLVIGVLFAISNLLAGGSEPSPRLNWGQILGVSFLLTLCLLMLGNPSPFLYFQF